MIAVKVTFNFDPETTSVSDVVCSVGDVVEKKTTTKKSTVKQVGKALTGLTIVREEGKLVLSPELIETLGTEDEIRVSIRYDKVGPKGQEVITPFFGNDLAFGIKGGNKLAKAGTVAYRGKANEILAEFGETFTLEETKPGIYMLTGDKVYVPKNIPVVEAVAKVKDIEVSGNETTELTEFTDFNL
jgi:hypothetical protein